MQSFLQSNKTSTYLRLDPRTKLLLVLIINIVCITGDLSIKMLIVKLILSSIPIALLLLSKKVKSGIIFSLLLTVCFFSGTFLTFRTTGALNIIVGIFTTVIGRMLPGIIMGYYLISTTTVSEFIAAMEKIHVPQCIIIPLAVMFRFFPTVKEESKSINEAMRMRGIQFAGGNPSNALEYRLVPLMMSTVKIGDELSAASLTRGLGSLENRTNICEVGFKLQDIILVLISILCFIAFILLKL